MDIARRYVEHPERTIREVSEMAAKAKIHPKIVAILLKNGVKHREDSVSVCAFKALVKVKDVLDKEFIEEMLLNGVLDGRYLVMAYAFEALVNFGSVLDIHFIMNMLKKGMKDTHWVQQSALEAFDQIRGSGLTTGDKIYIIESLAEDWSSFSPEIKKELLPVVRTFLSD